MPYKKPEIKRRYFSIRHVAIKAHLKTSYIRKISNKLGLPKKRSNQRRRYTKEEMDYVSKICKTFKGNTKIELAIKLVNEKP